MKSFKQSISKIGASKLVVTITLLALMISLFPLHINVGLSYADILVRIGMNGYLVLAMMISVVCGAGLNFGLPIGILCGLIGGSLAAELAWTGLGGLTLACICSLPFALLAGYLYGKLLNNVVGSEMTVGNYLAFSVVYIMCILWLELPYKNSTITWPMSGKGLRTTLTLDNNYTRVLDSFLKVDFKKMGILQNSPTWKDFSIPTGLLLVFAVGCILMFLFMHTKSGILMRCGGANPGFSRTIGLNTSKIRIYGMMASMSIAAIGINIYSQSYGFYQFYTAPLKMAFPAMAALLIGGATPKKATVFNVVFGIIIYEGLLTLATPVANALINSGSISEVIRVIVQNGIILYALTKIKSNGGK